MSRLRDSGDGVYIVDPDEDERQKCSHCARNEICPEHCAEGLKNRACQETH